jgi:hypothetical protein
LGLDWDENSYLGEKEFNVSDSDVYALSMDQADIIMSFSNQGYFSNIYLNYFFFILFGTRTTLAYTCLPCMESDNTSVLANFGLINWKFQLKQQLYLLNLDCKSI